MTSPTDDNANRDPAVRVVISPIALAIWLALFASVIVYVFHGSPRVLAAAAAGFVVGLITFLAATRG